MNMLHVCGPTCSDLPQHSSLEIYGGKRAYSTVLRKRNIFIQGQAFPFVHQWRLLRQWTLPWKFAPVFHLNRDSESFVLVIWCVLQCAAVCCSVSPWFRDIHLGNLKARDATIFVDPRISENKHRFNIGKETFAARFESTKIGDFTFENYIEKQMSQKPHDLMIMIWGGYD